MKYIHDVASHPLETQTVTEKKSDPVPPDPSSPQLDMGQSLVTGAGAGSVTAVTGGAPSEQQPPDPLVRHPSGAGHVDLPKTVTMLSENI